MRRSRTQSCADQWPESLAQVLGMSVMGLGGPIAITGGILYLVVVSGTLRRRLPAARAQAA